MTAGVPAESAASSRPSLGTAYYMIGALFLLYLLAWLDRLTIAMLVEPIKETLELGDFEMSLILGPAFAVSYALFAIPLGWAADHFPRRLVIFAGVAVWSLATIACAFATSFHTLILARIFVGIGEAALLPAGYSLIADAFPKDRVTFATSLFQTAGKGGSALAFGIGGLLIGFANTVDHLHWPLLGQAAGWQITFLLIGLPGLLLIFLVFTFPDPGRHNSGAHTRSADNSANDISLADFVRRHAGLLGLMVLAFTCLAVTGYSMTSWVPTYIDRHFHWTPQQYGPALSLMNIFGAVALVGLGKAVDILFSRGLKDAHLRFYSWLILGLSPVIVSAFFVPDVHVFLGFYALIQLITVPYIVYCFALVAMLAPNRLRGQLLGIFMFITNIIGFGLGPAIVGALTDFLFRDAAMVGYSLAIVVISGSTIAFFAMRFALPLLRRSIAMVEAGTETEDSGKPAE